MEKVDYEHYVGRELPGRKIIKWVPNKTHKKMFLIKCHCGNELIRGPRDFELKKCIKCCKADYSDWVGKKYLEERL